jgi:hypothetical protein
MMSLKSWLAKKMAGSTKKLSSNLPARYAKGMSKNKKAAIATGLAAGAVATGAALSDDDKEKKKKKREYLD